MRKHSPYSSVSSLFVSLSEPSAVFPAHKPVQCWAFCKMGSLQLHCFQDIQCRLSFGWVFSFLKPIMRVVLAMPLAPLLISPQWLPICRCELHPCIFLLLFVPRKEHFAWDWTLLSSSIPPLSLRPLIWARFSMATWHCDPSTIKKTKKMKGSRVERGCVGFDNDPLSGDDTASIRGAPFSLWLQSSGVWLRALWELQVQVRAQRAELFISVLY